MISRIIEAKIYISRAMNEASFFKNIAYLVAGVLLLDSQGISLTWLLGLIAVYIIYIVWDWLFVFKKELGRQTTINPELEILLKKVAWIEKRLKRGPP